MRGVDIFLDTLVDEDATVLFGNPGTTELPLIAALATRADLRYVLGLQESTVVGMADGYSRTTGRPCVVNLHAAAGLGNGIGNLTNAVAHRAPIVVTAGNADRRHAIADPLLSGDLVTLSSGVSKWSHEARSARELGTVMRRAFRLAGSHPQGPVFVSLPSDVLEEEDPSARVLARSFVASGQPAAGIDEAARLLTELPGDCVAIVAGDAVADADALGPLQDLAERLGCAVFGSPFYSRRVFPTTHPLWRGMIDARADAIAKALEPFTRVLVVDYQPFLVYPYTPVEPVPAHVDLLHLCPEVAQVGRTHAVRLGMVGDPRASLEALVRAIPSSPGDGSLSAERLAERQAADLARVERLVAERSSDQLHPMVAVHALISGLPRESIVVDEAVTAGTYVRGLHRSEGALTYWFCRGGGLGWGMPAAVGISLATGGEPVLAVIGDGSAMYSPQAMWTAARERLPVVFAVVDNGEYAILRRSLEAGGSSSRVGIGLGDPALEFSMLAQAMGVPATRTSSADEIRSTIAEVWGRGPHLIHVAL